MHLNNNRGKLFTLKIFCALTSAITAPIDAHAYIDPGTTGVLSQVLYVLFYGALGVFLFSLRYIKDGFARASQFIAKLFGFRS
jgi:hypothetical protein